MPLKLFVWREGVLTAYSDGIAFALARDADHARQLIYQAGYRSPDQDSYYVGIEGEPDEVRAVDQPCAGYIYGGA